MGDIEVGTCTICRKENVQLNRKYYRYDIKCICHSPQHFEIVYYCNNCTPIEPKETRITIETEYLNKILNKQSRKKKLKKLKRIK